MTAWLKDVIGYGLHAARPAAGSEGRLYYETDTDTLVRDNGATWDALILGSLSPLTTKGDVFVHGSGDARLPVGTNGQVLTADSTQTLGVKWATPSSGGGGELGYAQITSSFSTTSTSLVDVTGLSITITAPAGPFLVRVYAPMVDTATARIRVAIYDTTGAVVVASGYSTTVSGNGNPCFVLARVNPGAGSRSYKAQMNTLEGGTARMYCSATEPAFIQAVAC